MGGKGGGEGGGGGGSAVYDSELGMYFDGGYAIENGTGNKTNKTRADIIAERTPKPETKKEEPAPVTTAAAETEPEPTTAAPVQAIGTAIGTGGAVASPTASGNNTSANLGEALGGSVVTPPQYWVGGLNANTLATPRSTSGHGSLQTTQ